MKVLFLTNLLPYPLDNGGKIKTYTTLSALYAAGHDIDLLCFKEIKKDMIDEEKELLKICRSIKQVYLPLTTANHKQYMMKVALKSLVSVLPFAIYKYQSSEMNNIISEYSRNEYDIIYLDHLPMCVYLKKVKSIWVGAKIILDEHNCETLISKRKATESNHIVKKVFFKYEAYKLEKFEADSILNVNQTIVLSSEDYNFLKRLTKKDFDYSIIPIAVPDKGIKKCSSSNGKALNILFVGTLTWEPNNAGLIWFLKNVLPIIEKKALDYHLYIIGKNPSETVVKLCGAFGDKITITGYVNSLDDYYDICDCAIVPLFIGSGQRVKLIEAFSKGMPAISTKIGAEGLNYEDGKTIIIADDDTKFAEAIIAMTDHSYRRELQINSRLVYEKYYSPQAVFGLIQNAVDR